MSDTLESLRRKINGAGELQSVVRTMKALAAASIGQYERAVQALGDYYRTVELALAASLRTAHRLTEPSHERGITGAIVFGSDQGLVGQFNETLADYAIASLRAHGHETLIWTVGERMKSHLAESGFTIAASYETPNSVNAITPLISRLLLDTETRREQGELSHVFIFHNRPKTGALYEPVTQRLLPLDDEWRRALAEVSWPTKNLPEVIDPGEASLLALVREYLFVSLYRACAESLASENTSRLAAMQRAEKNIDDLLNDLGHTFHRLRQSSIDEELFDVVAGFQSISSQ